MISLTVFSALLVCAWALYGIFASQKKDYFAWREDRMIEEFRGEELKLFSTTDVINGWSAHKGPAHFFWYLRNGIDYPGTIKMLLEDAFEAVIEAIEKVVVGAGKILIILTLPAWFIPILILKYGATWKSVQNYKARQEQAMNSHFPDKRPKGEKS